MALQKVPSVSEVVGQIKSLLEGEFRTISLEGEVSNLSKSASGHWYFSLSDRQSLISVALFKMDAARNPIIRNIKNGDRLICSGSIGVYTKRGSFQVLAKKVIPYGKGLLKEQFEVLKKKLASEGLFDISRKRKIPKYPKRIALITAKKSAAYEDFFNIMRRRSFYVNVLFKSALVQGEKAPESLRSALFDVIKYSLDCDDKDKPDVIVLTRGGGSLEDLWAFNDEALAWDIYNSPIPVISAVGHEVDYSISDAVADLRVETPSAAAEILSDGQFRTLEKIKNLKKRLRKELVNKSEAIEMKISKVHPKSILGKIWNLFHSIQMRISKVQLSMRSNDHVRLSEYAFRVDDAYKVVVESIEKASQDKVNKAERLYSMLKVLDPKNVLARGFAIVHNESEEVISSRDELVKDTGHSYSVVFRDGKSQLYKK